MGPGETPAREVLMATLVHDCELTDVWPPKDGDRYDKSGHIFAFESTYPESGEWIRVETHDFHNQMGYSRNVESWVIGMARRAVREGRLEDKLMPPFNPKNRVEVIVRIIPAE